MSIKKFNFVSTITEAELVKVESGPKQSKNFEPGEYDLKIIDASINVTAANPTGRSPKDPNWFVVKLVLGGVGDKTINHYLLVPTITDLFNPESGSKNPRFMFTKFREFLRGAGLPAAVDEITETLETYFLDVIQLIGKEVKVVIGYEGNHLRYNADKTYSIVDAAEDKELFDDKFPDRDSGIAFAASLNMTLHPFTKIKKFIAADLSKAEVNW